MPTDLLDPRVDPPLTVLIPKDGPPVTVCAAPPVLDTVHRLQQAQERITEALIANQDQLAALRALIGVPIDALSDDTALELMLTEALGARPGGRGAARQVDQSPGGVHAGAASDRVAPGRRCYRAAGGRERQSWMSGTGSCFGPHYTTGELKLVDAVLAAWTSC